MFITLFWICQLYNYERPILLVCPDVVLSPAQTCSSSVQGKDQEGGAILGMTVWCKSISYPTPANNSFILKIEYRLMITVPTHKCHKKVLLNTQKTIYVFTSGRVIVTVEIHNSRTKAFKGVKMTTAKWTISTGEQQQNLCYPAARFNEKGCLLVWGWRCCLRQESSMGPKFLE